MIININSLLVLVLLIDVRYDYHYVYDKLKWCIIIISYWVI